MKQTLEILIKLKLMLTSYTELFNGSITENIMRSFWCPQKKNPAQTFPHNIYAVLCGKIFIHFIIVSPRLDKTNLCGIPCTHPYLLISHSVELTRTN